MIGFCLGLLLLVGNAQAAIEDVSKFRLPLPRVETLENGLTVAWFLDEKLPIVDLALQIGSGTRYDPRGKSGTVELLARMLERGSNGFGPAEIAQKVESLGASGFASADEEATTLGMHGLSQDAETLLEILSWVALRPNFRADEFQRERAKVAESWKHLADSAESLSGYAFGRAILSGTPYARGSLQDLRSLRALKLTDLRTFHQTHFTPANALLMVVGRVDQKSFRDKIRAHFGTWKGSMPKKNDVLFRDPKLSLRLEKKMDVSKREILVIDSPGLPQAQLRIGFRVPGIRSPKRYALAVGNALLGEYFNSRLNLVVRDRLGLAYTVQSSVTYFRDVAFFSIGSATAAANAGKLLEETIRQIRLMKAADVLKEEVDVAKEYLMGGFPLGVSTLGAVAVRWLNGRNLGLGDEYLNGFLPNISTVSRESVVQAFDEAFAVDRMVVVIAGDAKKIEASLREKGFRKVRRIPGKSLL